MARRAICTVVALISIIPLGASCGSSDDSAGAGGQGAAGAGGADAGADATSEALVFRVVDVDGQPISGATVALDPESGSRTEVTTASDGLASFEFPDLSGRGPSVTAYAPSYELVTWVALGAASEPPVKGEPTDLVLPGLAPDWATISGQFLNPVAAGHKFQVSSTKGSWVQTQSGSYQLKVPRDEPFSLLAVEYTATLVGQVFDQPFFAWSRVDNAGVAGDATVDIDLSQTVATETVAGSFKLPASPSVFQQPAAWGYIIVATFSSGFRYGLGYATHSEYRADSSAVDYVVELTKQAPDTDTGTWYMLRENAGTIVGPPPAYTIVTQKGYPTAGDHDLPFLEPPVVQDPQPIKFSDEISWQPDDPAIGSTLWITDGARQVWLVSIPPGVTSLVLPAPPSTLDLDLLLASVAEVDVGQCELTDLAKFVCARAAIRPLLLER